MSSTSLRIPLTNLGLSFGVVNCLVVFPTHFNRNNSLLIILQISLLFMYTPALMTNYYEAFSTSTSKFLGQIQTKQVIKYFNMLI